MTVFQALVVPLQEWLDATSLYVYCCKYSSVNCMFTAVNIPVSKKKKKKFVCDVLYKNN